MAFWIGFFLVEAIKLLKKKPNNNTLLLAECVTNCTMSKTFSLICLFGLLSSLSAFAPLLQPRTSQDATILASTEALLLDRRAAVQQIILSTGMVVAGSAVLSWRPDLASAASFTAGGSLVDRDVGVQVGNSEASPSRRQDNSNVIFDKDHYFKFGVAAPWIEPGSTDFPKKMPFTPSQQRYDALKKYGSRVRSGVEFLANLENAAKSADFATAIPDPANTAEYALRPMGLLANNFLASENTGATNELFLARWYINEIYLQMMDARSASSSKEATRAYSNAKKAMNSYLGMMNRVINAKVGDPFVLIAV